MPLNKAQYSPEELNLFPTYATPEIYKAATGKDAPWDPARAPKYWFDPAAAEALAANPATKKYRQYMSVIAVNEVNGVALADATGKPYFDPDPLILSTAEAATVNIPPKVANVPGADQPPVQCPKRALDLQEELAFYGAGGVVTVRNIVLWGKEVIEPATTFLPTDRALLQAIGAKLGVVV